MEKEFGERKEEVEQKSLPETQSCVAALEECNAEAPDSKDPEGDKGNTSNARQNNWSWSKAKQNDYLHIWVTWKYWRELRCRYVEQLLNSNQGSRWTTTTPQRYSKNAPNTPKKQSVPVLPKQKSVSTVT